MQSTHGNFSCSDFKKLKNEDVIKGKFSCNATNDNPTTANGTSGTGSGTSSGSGSSSTSSGAAYFNGANVPVVGIAAVFGALASML